MAPQHESIIERLAVQAICLGADNLEVDYKDGEERVFAAKGGIGHGIASFRSSSPEAALLRKELHSLTKKKRRLVVADSQYELRGRVYESFGEDAFQVELRRV